MSTHRLLVDRLHELFNARRFEDLCEVFDENVLMVIEGTPLRGLTEVRDYFVGMVGQLPDLRVEHERVLAESEETIVTLTRAAETPGGAPGEDSQEAWSEPITTLLIVRRILAGRIQEYRVYPYSGAGEESPGGIRAVRAGIHRLVGEQAALLRVAELVARGAATQQVLDAVTVEARRLLADVPAALWRVEPSGGAVVVAQSGEARPLGARMSAVGWVTGTGGPGEMLPFRADGCVWAPILVAGRMWGILAAYPEEEPLPGAEERLTRFCELVAAAIANAESRAELTASRARIVASADEARRRLARDVHDGAQQRLVHAVIRLKQARTALGDSGTPLARLVDESLLQAEAANAQLRELAQGILPAALTRDGLRAGVQSLLRDMPLPVEAEVLSQRLPERVEITAYFVIAEALTNVIKHAEASRARVRALAAGEWLEAEVSDDGRGGADPAGGSGLIGLIDRVEAAGGTMSLSSPSGAGTRVVVTLPIPRVETATRE